MLPHLAHKEHSSLYYPQKISTPDLDVTVGLMT